MIGRNIVITAVKITITAVTIAEIETILEIIVVTAAKEVIHEAANTTDVIILLIGIGKIDTIPVIAVIVMDEIVIIQVTAVKVLVEIIIITIVIIITAVVIILMIAV